MIDIMWYTMSILAGPRLVISAYVQGSAGKHNSGALTWGVSAVGSGRWDGA